jgi:acyl-CoA synthetase
MSEKPMSTDAALADSYRAANWWQNATIAELVAELATTRPTDSAYVTESGRFTWGDYGRVSDQIASALLGAGFLAGERVAVVLPDGAAVHAALVGAEKAGLVAVGIGAKAGDRELAHLLERTGAKGLITHEMLAKNRPASDLWAKMTAECGSLLHHITVPNYGADPATPLKVDGEIARGDMARVEPKRRIGPDDLFMLNSTSGTTGLPKCVMHTQNRWFYFHKLAMESGGFKNDEVFMGAVPAPFGFGLWTAHFSPTILGCPTVVMERFDADAALDLIEREKVTVLCCVSTQFIMMLNAQEKRPRELSSLRSMYTGGEAVPYDRAAEFEDVTGAAVLQFYGSNETGALSYTSRKDTREKRLRTAGKTIDAMNVRLFDPDTGEDITGAQSRGQPGCKGPAECLGYWNDDAANKKLYTPDGYMLMGDVVEIDDDGYLSVVGRTSDFIIRGGKNISAPAVEEELGSHPDVAMVCVVAAPDPVFGERVCAYVVSKPEKTVSLESLVEHLSARGVTRDWYPEHLVLIEELPRSSGGKVAKGDLREDAQRRFRQVR